MKKGKKVIISGMVLISFLLFFDWAKAGWSLNSIDGFGLPDADIQGIITNIVEWILTVFWIISLGAFMVSGIIYLVSTGDEEMITKAKKYMKYSIMGVIVGLSGYVIIQAVSIMLSGQSSF